MSRLILLMGPPGAGKTTQATRIAATLSIKHLSAGDVARQLATFDEETKEALEAGQLAPRDKMNDMMATILSHQSNTEQSLVLDGYPRYLYQLVDVFYTQTARPAFVLLDVPLPEVRQRLIARKRDDDTVAAIDSRIRTYEDETLPVIDYLERRQYADFFRVNGLGDIPQVFNRVMNFLRYGAE